MAGDAVDGAMRTMRPTVGRLVERSLRSVSVSNQLWSPRHARHQDRQSDPRSMPALSGRGGGDEARLHGALSVSQREGQAHFDDLAMKVVLRISRLRFGTSARNF
jgi:hypothetical protein